MADNDSSFWREEFINYLDNFEDENIHEMQEIYDECISDDEEVG